MMKIFPPSESLLDRYVRAISVIGALLSLLYYFGIGVMVGFGVSLLFVWLLLALFLSLFALFFPSLRKLWQSLKKPIRRLAIGLLLLAITYLLVCSGAILSGFTSDIPDDKEVDCLIILGAQVKADRPSLALERRIYAAYDYLTAHPHTVAIASGGQGQDEPISEAQCIFDCLVEMGISPERIILEDRSTSTAENLQFSKKLIPEDCKSVAIVTNNFHAFRGECIARNYLTELEIYRLPAEFHLYMLPHYFVREIAALSVDTFIRGNLRLR